MSFSGAGKFRYFFSFAKRLQVSQKSIMNYIETFLLDKEKIKFCNFYFLCDAYLLIKGPTKLEMTFQNIQKGYFSTHKLFLGHPVVY